MKVLEAVLFDFGHTLFTTRSPEACAAEFQESSRASLDSKLFASAWEEIRQRSRTPEELAKGRDLSPEAHRQCWMELLAPLDDLADGLAEFTYGLESSARGWEPYPDTASVLSELAERGVTVAVVSDCAWDIRQCFKAYGLDPYVHAFRLSYEYGACKPDPGIFRAACRDLSVRPEQAVMVGDSWLTDGGGAAAGILTLILPERDRRAHPALGYVLQLVG
jgi:HAD superfamily hydrolase (TIGR01509 family)